jgi:hypothetical protein
MHPINGRLRPGDVVVVKSAQEILETLDSEGTLDRLPFMPEMAEYCGRRFRVSKKVLKTCYYGHSTGMRTFPADDVVILEDVRCSGAAHDGCQKACNIFWREAWLRRVDGPEGLRIVPADSGQQQLRSRLKTKTGPNTYFCQASEILNATGDLSRGERFWKCVDEVRWGNCGVVEMAGRIGVWLFWRVRRSLLGVYGRGTNKSTPTESLALRPGERVEVKPMKSISETLDERSFNRGLSFTPAMRQLCGEQRRVDRKLEKIIVDGTGAMRTMRDTVFLEGSLCGCSCVAFGGCPRGEYAYWREIWLRRLQAQEEDPPATWLRTGS